jgi:hypothetical protein
MAVASAASFKRACEEQTEPTILMSMLRKMSAQQLREATDSATAAELLDGDDKEVAPSSCLPSPAAPQRAAY